MKILFVSVLVICGFAISSAFAVEGGTVINGNPGRVCSAKEGGSCNQPTFIQLPDGYKGSINIDSGSNEKSNNYSSEKPNNYRSKDNTGVVMQISVNNDVGILNTHSTNGDANSFLIDDFFCSKYEKALRAFYQGSDISSDQNTLGIMYALGMGVPMDYTQALHLFYKSAAGNYAPAYYNLGMTYAFGNGVRVNYKEAEKWFHKYDPSVRIGYRQGKYHIEQDFHGKSKICNITHGRRIQSGENGVGSVQQNYRGANLVFNLNLNR